MGMCGSVGVGYRYRGFVTGIVFWNLCNCVRFLPAYLVPLHLLLRFLLRLWALFVKSGGFCMLGGIYWYDTLSRICI